MNIIYSIRNLVNDKVYIGKSTKGEKRFKEHIDKLNKDSHHNRHLQFSWNKYGIDNFEFTVIFEDVEENMLDYLEIVTIKLFNSKELGYNLTDGGDGSGGYVFTEDDKRKVKENRKSPYNKGEDHVFYGKKHTDDAILKIKNRASGENNSMFGKNHSESTKSKISDSLKKRNEDKYRDVRLEIIKLRNLGYSYTEISKEIGMCYTFVYYTINKKPTK